MYSWSENERYWAPMVKGKPTHSKYFWSVIIFSLTTLLGVGKLATKMYGNHELEQVLAPALIMLVALMGLAGSRAIDVIRRVREQVNSTASPEKEVLNRLAFDFFFMYLCFAVMATAAVWLLIVVLF